MGLPSAAPHSTMLGFPHDSGVRVFTWILILKVPFPIPNGTAGSSSGKIDILPVRESASVEFSGVWLNRGLTIVLA